MGASCRLGLRNRYVRAPSFFRGVIFSVCILGKAAVELNKFKEVIGIDPSETMLARARELLDSTPLLNKISFVQSKAEDLNHLEAESIDMVISGKYSYVEMTVFRSQNLFPAQAAHWFDYEKLWPQLARILRKEGTVAFWVSLLL